MLQWNPGARLSACERRPRTLTARGNWYAEEVTAELAERWDFTPSWVSTSVNFLLAEIDQPTVAALRCDERVRLVEVVVVCEHLVLMRLRVITSSQGVLKDLMPTAVWYELGTKIRRQEPI